jgi:acetyl-CoA synthetase
MDSALHWNARIKSLVKRDGFLNISHLALDKQAEGAFSNSPAIRYLMPSWSPDNSLGVVEITYRELAEETHKFAKVLRKLGVTKGDVVFSLSPRVPELYSVALGTLRNGCIYAPLFSAFGPGPIQSRMNKGAARVIFSLSSIFRKKIFPILNTIPSLKHIILIDDDGLLHTIPHALNYHHLLGQVDSSRVIERTAPVDPAFLHFTSGTTGEPKGAIHLHQSVVFHQFSAQYALDLRPGDVFWCTADPGWVTGTSYGLIAPLCIGATLLIDGSEFSASRWYSILEHFKVDVWYSAPTAFRMLMKAGEELANRCHLSHLRFAASVGEPLNPEVIKWVQKHLNIVLHDNWWQTETGGIMIANDCGQEMRAGSMGKPLPGIEVALIKDYQSGQIVFSGPLEQGEIAIKKGWPSLFSGYLGQPEKYAHSFTGDWYLSGDLARKDQDGYFWFIGRKDDVIKSSGHLIGPFEVENVLMSHPAVLESAVIGIPDSVVGELIKAYVVLKKNFLPSEDIKLEILSYARLKLGASLAPREIQFSLDLPKTRSGKIMRRLLKARELGLPEGDLSTLEVSSGKG